MLFIVLVQIIFSNCINQKTYEEASCDEEGVLYYSAIKEASFWKYGESINVLINNESTLVLIKAEYANIDNICMKIYCEGCLIKNVFGNECGKNIIIRKCLVEGVGVLKGELYGVKTPMWYLCVYMASAVGILIVVSTGIIIALALKNKKTLIKVST